VTRRLQLRQAQAAVLLRLALRRRFMLRLGRAGIRVDQRLSAKESRSGRNLLASVDPVLDGSGTRDSKGAPVTGRWSMRIGAAFQGASELELRLTSLTLNGKEYPLDTADMRSARRARQADGSDDWRRRGLEC